MTDETSKPASNAASEQTDSKPKAQPRKQQTKPVDAPARCPVCTQQLKHTAWQAPRLSDGRCSHCGYQQQ